MVKHTCRGPPLENWLCSRPGARAIAFSVASVKMLSSEPRERTAYHARPATYRGLNLISIRRQSLVLRKPSNPLISAFVLSGEPSLALKVFPPVELVQSYPSSVLDVRSLTPAVLPAANLGRGHRTPTENTPILASHVELQLQPTLRGAGMVTLLLNRARGYLRRAQCCGAETAPSRRYLYSLDLVRIRHGR